MGKLITQSYDAMSKFKYHICGIIYIQNNYYNLKVCFNNSDQKVTIMKSRGVKYGA